MPTISLPADLQFDALRATSAPSPSASPLSQEFATLLSALQTALDAHLASPADQQLWQDFEAARLAAATLAARWPKRNINDPSLSLCRELIFTMARSGAQDLPVSDADRAWMNAWADDSWPGLLATMLMTAAWQCPAAPELSRVPDWLWGDYAGWLFAPVLNFETPGDASAYTTRLIRRTEELANWIERNAGSAAVRAAGEAYLLAGSPSPLVAAPAAVKRHAESRARILTRLLTHGETPHEPDAFPLNGRRLRVGFVCRDFGAHAGTRAVLPWFERLDPERFESALFAFGTDDSPLEKHCRRRAPDFQTLPPDLEGRLSTLREAALDAVVFWSATGHEDEEITRLALRRVAPLQVFKTSSGHTSGLSTIDLHVSGTLTASPETGGHFTERLGLLPGPAHALNREIARGEPCQPASRAAFGLPEDAFVFVTAAPTAAILPEVRETWSRLLAAVPGSYLFACPFTSAAASDYAVQRFCTGFDRTLKKHGVDDSRLVISTGQSASLEETKAMLGLGDLYLDAFPGSDVEGLASALEAGLPAVTITGESSRSRVGAAILQALELDELVAADEAAYFATASQIAGSLDKRASLQSRVADAIERTPVFFDALAASDAFGSLLERAFEELAEIGPEAFRTARTPISSFAADPDLSTSLAKGRAALAAGETDAALAHGRAALRAAPADLAARHLTGAALLALGRTGPACDYLLAAIYSAGAGHASLWFDLARALQCEGRRNQALEALEASLRLDPGNLDAWIMLVDLAQTCGSTEIAREALVTAQAIAPGDPRLALYTGTFG